MSIKLDKIIEKWEEGCENGLLDPGHLFGTLVDYCEDLEDVIQILKTKVADYEKLL